MIRDVEVGQVGRYLQNQAGDRGDLADQLG
jgi:hypothetical protein